MRRVLSLTLTAALAFVLIGTADDAQSAPVITSDLLAFYDFNGANAADFTGTYDGTVMGGVTFVDGAAEFAAVHGFSGINTGLNINASVQPALTMGAWVYTPSAHNTSGKFLSHDNGSFDRTLGVDLRGHNGGTDYAAFNGITVIDDTGIFQDYINDWAHVAVSYDGTNTKLFVNGALVRSATDFTGVDSSHHNLFIGTNPGFNEDFVGRLDDVFVYGAALSDAQISQIYNGGITTTLPAVPLPAGLPLLALGLAGLGITGRISGRMAGRRRPG